MKKTGSNLLNMINNMNVNQTSNNNVNSESAKRKMKGPNINLGDIPDI
jgi:hypothetical protein